VTLLAISGDAPGRTFPLWKVAFSNNRKLQDVVRCWANAFLGLDVAAEVPAGAHAHAGSQTLDLQSDLRSLRGILQIRHGAFKLGISWPGDALPQTATPAGRAFKVAEKLHHGVRSKLRKLHPSARYCHVDRRVMGWGSSSTHKSKIQAGVYSETRGHYPEAHFASAMRTPPLPKDGKVELQSRLLAALDDDDQVIFQARLEGPAHHVQNWEAVCQRYERFLQQKSHRPEKQALQAHTPYPVFIPSRGRPEKAHLNWEAPHVFGAQDDKELGSRPVVCIVVECVEEDEYRAAWPLSLMLVLPESHRGPGYARWAVQRVCTRARMTAGESAPTLCRLGRIWIVDDSLTMFYRLALMEKFRGTGRLARPRRMKYRAASSERMFFEAMMAVQQHPFAARAAVAGFLRDDGTAVCKRNDWKKDELALYKVVLLDLHELWRLRVEYVQHLQMYEDICLNHDVLSRGGHTLKCQSYGFRAVHAKKGGCLQQRSGQRVAGRKSGETKLKDLVKKSAFREMNKDRQQAIRELWKWVKDKELLFKKRTDKEPADAAASGTSDRKPALAESDGHSAAATAEIGGINADSIEAMVVSDDSDEEDLKMMSANSQRHPLRWGIPKHEDSQGLA